MESDERPFQCESCSKRYLRKNNLEDHVLMEHPDTEQVLGDMSGVLLIMQWVQCK